MSNQEIIEEVPKFPGVYMYHKDLGAVLFESADEVEALDKKEWADNPAKFKPAEVVKKFVPTKPLEKMTKIELVQAGISIGLEKEKLAGQTKEEIIALLK